MVRTTAGPLLGRVPVKGVPDERRLDHAGQLPEQLTVARAFMQRHVELQVQGRELVRGPGPGPGRALLRPVTHDHQRREVQASLRMSLGCAPHRVLLEHAPAGPHTARPEQPFGVALRRWAGASSTDGG